MRGLRSFGGLVVILIALGGYLYFVESKKPAGSDAEKKEKVFTVEADKIEEFTIKSESGERTTLRKSGSDWQIAQAPGVKPDSGEVSGITSNLSSLEIQRVIDENPSDLTEYGLTQPRVEVALQGRRQGSQAADRTEDAAGDRPLRAGRRPEEGLADSVVRGHHLQQDDLRSPRQSGPQGQPRRDRIAERHDAGEHDALREVQRRVEAGAARSGARGFQRGRSARQPLDEPPDEVDCRASGNRRRAVRPRQTGRDGDHRLRIVPGHARDRQVVGRGRGLRARPVEASRRDGRIGARRRAQEGSGRVSPEGSLRRPGVQLDAARTGPRTARRRHSRRSSRRTRTARSRRPGSRSLRPRKTSTRRKSRTSLPRPPRRARHRSSTRRRRACSTSPS